MKYLRSVLSSFKNSFDSRLSRGTWISTRYNLLGSRASPLWRIALLGTAGSGLVYFGSSFLGENEANAESKSKVKGLKDLKMATGHPIYKVVLTGGPCGGKSTALTQLSSHFASLGFKVYLVPEAATLLIGGGCHYSPTFSTAQNVSFQANLMKAQMALENSFVEIAKTIGGPAIIFCDRGTMDGNAYIDNNTWELILDENNWTRVELRDNRYDAVIHLVTAALGADKFYTTENNAARSETAEEAKLLDHKVLNAWVGHPHLKVIDNSSDFQGKIQRVVESVCQIVGVPIPVVNQRRYLIKEARRGPSEIKFEEFDIEQTYLVSAKLGEARVRRRGQHGRNSYDYSIKRSTEEDKHIILEKVLIGREYVALLAQADPQRSTVKKKVQCFLYKNNYFFLNQYVEPLSDIVILEVDSEDPKVELPPWLEVEQDVTGNDDFSSYEIANKNKTDKIGR